jgi:hypothetical protein
LGSKTYSWNGAVDIVSTRFSVIGGPEQVSEFFGEITKRVHDLPVERLADELNILRVEGDKRSRNQFGIDLATRFGATGPGLIDWREAGFYRLDADEVQRWAHDWFTAANAALWLSGPLPAGLDLSALPQGGTVTRANPRCLTGERTFVGGTHTSTSLSVLSDGQWGITPAVTLLRQRAFDKLRLEDALCYDIGQTSERIGGSTLISFLIADGAEGAQRRVFDGLVEMIEDMAANGPRQDELDTYVQRLRQWQDHPSSHMSKLDYFCERTVLGLETMTDDERWARIEGLTPESIASDLTCVMPTLLATGTAEMGDVPGWTIHEEWSADLVSGTTYKAIAEREDGELVVGEDGISWVYDADRRRTVRWSDVAACYCLENGVRHVLGTNGYYVSVVPWNWQGGSNLTEIIDAHIRPECRLNTGEGDLQYRRDREDPDSVVDVRWLASLTGAFHRQRRVDLVIDTDGLLLLFGATSKDAVPQRLAELRSLDRQSLLSGNESNRWFPEGEIAEIKLARRPLARLNTLKSTLTIRTTGSEVLKVHLVSERQVELAKDSFPKLLGPRFRA